MKSPKITKEEIVKGAKFDLKIGSLEIIAVEKDGYGKGDDLVRTKLNDKPYADDVKSIVAFVNSNRK